MTAELVAGLDAALVEPARAVDPARLRGLASQVRHAVEPALLIHDEVSAHASRRLHASLTFAGLLAVDGLLDPEGGAVLLTALDALSAPTGADPRTPAQRRADALVQLARLGLDSGGLPESGTERPHLAVTVDVASLRGEPGAPGGALDRTGPISGAAARRLACDAGLTRVITAGASEILDIGRRTRTVPAAIRRALVHRDRGCAFPDCDRPPSWCDAHHLQHWIDGGATALPNLALLCSAHHRLVHEHGWTLHRHPTGQLTAHPPSPAAATTTPAAARGP